MSPRASCPRCQTVVAYEAGERPVCPTCGYPGADLRAPPPVQGSWADTGPAWDAPPSAPGFAQRKRTSEKAVTGLVFGILGIVTAPLGFLLGIVAVVLGILARRDVRASGGTLEGNGLAVAGIAIGAIAIVLGAIVLAVLVITLISDLSEGSEAVVTLLAR